MLVVSCLQSVVFPVPDGAEIIKRIPRRSVEDRTGPEGVVSVLVVVVLIRRFEPVPASVPTRLSCESHVLRFLHRWPWSRSY